MEDWVETPFEGDFVLRVKGESMMNASILDGDLVVVKQQDTARNGEIVVALIDDEATVKRFFREDGHVRLAARERRVRAHHQHGGAGARQGRGSAAKAMTPPGVMMELPTLFNVDGQPPLGHSLDDAVLTMLAEPAGGVCIVCDGGVETVAGGVRCVDCGSELLLGAEPAPAWVA